MPIEFRCHHCQALLRVKDDTAGLITRCPRCDTTLTVPEAGQAPREPPAEETPPHEAQAPAEPQWTVQPAGEVNPYQTPQSHEAAWRPGPVRPTSQEDATATLSFVLGICSVLAMFCCGMLGLPLSIGGLVTGIMGLKSKQRGLAIAGIALSSVSLLLVLAMIVWIGVVISMEAAGGF